MAEPDAGDRGAGPDRLSADVAQRAAAGDLEAFQRLVELHQAQVLRTARALLGNREDARDAAQETFLRVYRFLGRYDPRREFRAWLYRIVVNVCRDLFRKRGRVPTAPLEDADPALLARPGEQEMNADAGDRVRRVRRALAALPPKEAEALVLRDIEGLSTHEVARALGCLEVTVRSHLSRGRLKLRAALDRGGGGGL
jgi:RNA polymerase sigma-70 factor (ECF subfamily)